MASKKKRKVAAGRRPSVRSQGRPSLAQASEIDSTIRHAAIEVLLERGEATTLNDVAAAAGLSRKTVYARYTNKSELFLHAVRDLLSQARTLPVPAKGTAEERLYGFLRTALDIVSMQQSRAIQRLFTFNPEFIGALQTEMRDASDQKFVLPLRTFLAEMHASGDLHVPEPEAVARAIVNLFHAESLMPDPEGQGAGGDSWRDRHAQFLANLFVRGLRRR